MATVKGLAARKLQKAAININQTVDFWKFLAAKCSIGADSNSAKSSSPSGAGGSILGYGTCCVYPSSPPRSTFTSLGSIGFPSGPML